MRVGGVLIVDRPLRPARTPAFALSAASAVWLVGSRGWEGSSDPRDRSKLSLVSDLRKNLIQNAC